MSISLLALQRARKQLALFCAQRSAPGGAVLDCHVEDDSLILRQDGQARIRLQADGTRWRIFWCGDDAQWRAWPHLPVCDDIGRVIDELEQAPLHVHWSE